MNIVPITTISSPATSLIAHYGTYVVVAGAAP